MGEVAGESVVATGGTEAPPPPATPTDCPRCHADLTRYGPAARFCPRCGNNRSTADSSASVFAATTPITTPLTAVVPSEIPSGPARAESAHAAPDAVPAALQPPPLPVLAITEHASSWMRLRTAPSATARGTDDSHSLMLLGYANAMFRLGYRYETGLGNNRNPDEAIRCYFKAAKLGNAAALARLAPRCAGSSASPVEPPPAAAPAPPP